MKKIIVFLFLLAGMVSLQAQTEEDTYKIEWDFIIKTPEFYHNFDLYRLEITFNFTDGSTYTDIFSYGYIDRPKGPAYFSSKAIERVDFQYLFSQIGNTVATGTKQIYPPELHGYNNPCIYYEDDNFASDFDFSHYAYLQIKATPINLRIYSDSPDNILADCKTVHLWRKGGYSSYFYSSTFWEYSIGDSDSWSSFTPHQGNKEEVEISGDMIYNFSSFVGRENIKIRMKSRSSVSVCDYLESNILTFSPMICGPELVSAEGIPGCGDGNNGKIRLTYSRPLYEGEYLNFVVYDQYSGDTYGTQYGWSDPNITKNLEQQEIIISGLAPGTYKLRIIGYLNGDTQTVYTDASGNYSIENIVVGTTAPARFKIKGTSGVSCPGSNDGTVTITASGGSGKYRYELYTYDNPSEPFVTGTFQEEVTVSGLPEGDYDVKVFDLEGCEAEPDGNSVAIVDGPEEFEIDEVELQLSTYNDNGEEAGNGSITISVYPYGQSYRFIWKAGSGAGTTLLNETAFETSKLENISSGTYYVQVINNSGCSVDSLIVLPAYPKILINIVQTGTIVCSGDNTGQLEATVTGGTPPYQYAWYEVNEYTQAETLIPGANTNVLSSIPAGLYRLQVEDAEGSKARSALVSQTEENPLSASFSTIQLNCPGDSNGFLEISVSGGTPPYTYTWDNGATGTRIENLTAGNYGIKVTDNAGCFKHFTGTVIGPLPLTIDAQVYHPACFGMSNGGIYLQVTGGNQPYTYTWNDGSGSATRDNLPAGNYSVEITDNSGCETIRREFVLYEPEPVEIDLIGSQSVSQFGWDDGKFTIRISGATAPYTVSCLLNGSQPITPTNTYEPGDGSLYVYYENLFEGEYTVTAAGENYRTDPLYSGCMATTQVIITEPAILSVVLREIHPITCYNGNDGTLFAEGVGGAPNSPVPYLYEWFQKDGTDSIPLLSGQDTLSDLAEGIYIVKITDKNGISAFSPEYRLLSPDTLQLTFKVNPVTCTEGDNGRVEAVVTGGDAPYTYLWNTKETGSTISQKESGTYSVTVTDRRGCQVSGSAVIEPPESFNISYVLRPLSCYALNDGAIRLNVQGDYAPYTYQWSDGSTLSSIENLAPGEYTVIVTDAKDCSTGLSFIIPELEPISITLTELIPPSGFGYSDGFARVEITGGNRPYHVTGFKEDRELPGSVELTYDGEKAVAVLRNVSEGNYSLRIEDANYQSTREAGLNPSGCFETCSFYIPQPPRLEVRIEQTHDITCNGGNDGALVSFAEGGVLFPNGLPYLYQWEKDDVPYESGTAEISNLPQGAYRLKITDANGIEAYSETIVIDQPDPLVLQFQSADIKCSRDTDGWAEVSVTGGTAPYTYEWTTGDPTPRIENIPRGKYMVTVTDANQCQTTGVVEIIQANAIRVEAQLIEPTCFEGSDGAIRITLSDGEPPYSYYWENGSQTLDYTGLSKGSYTFTVTDAHGCGYETVTYHLGEPEKIVVDLGEDRELCKGQTLTIEAKILEPAHSFTWYDAAQRELFTGAKYTLSDAGVYTVKAITAKGCTAYGNITVTRDDREISADFIVASQVPINDEVFLVNIAVPAPESSEWILPESGNFEVITQNQQLLSVIFRDYGTYTLGMRSYSGKCWETVYKVIRVMDKFDIDNYEEADEPMLKSFTVNPNPASQRFRVNIELKEDSPVDLYLINTGTGVVSAHKRLSGDKVYNEWFEVPAAKQGTYVISLVAPKAKGAQKIILY